MSSLLVVIQNTVVGLRPSVHFILINLIYDVIFIWTRHHGTGQRELAKQVVVVASSLFEVKSVTRADQYDKRGGVSNVPVNR